MNNLVLLLFIILVIACTTAVFACHSPRPVSAGQAVAKALRWWAETILDSFGWGKPPLPEYPVHVGYDSMNILPQIVDKELEKMRKSFDSCYCQNYSVLKNRIQYLFPVLFPKSAQDDMEHFKNLIQKQAEEGLVSHMRKFDCQLPAEPLTVIQLLSDSLIISYARNEEGIREIAETKRKRRSLEHMQKPEPETFYEKWTSTPIDRYTDDKSAKMVWGYQADAYRDEGILMSIRLNIATHCHALITGSSGSGKSQALLFLMGKLLQAQPDICLYVCDFKKSEDFKFLEGYPYYYAGKDCYNGIMAYYERFSEIRENGSDGRRYLLICDEYPSLINYLQMLDKQNKTKYANDILGAVSEILMLGRGTGNGCSVWFITQRSDSSLFSNGARDNFMVIIGLGKLSKEQRVMTFAGEEIPDRIFHAGEGMLLADGEEITAVKYPLIEDTPDWKSHILTALMRHDSARADVQA